MNLDLTDEETAAPLRELDALIDGDRYFMSQRIKTLNAVGPRIAVTKWHDVFPTVTTAHAYPWEEIKLKA